VVVLHQIGSCAHRLAVYSRGHTLYRAHLSVPGLAQTRPTRLSVRSAAGKGQLMAVKTHISITKYNSVTP
jgi:hypothetical protein